MRANPGIVLSILSVFAAAPNVSAQSIGDNVPGNPQYGLAAAAENGTLSPSLPRTGGSGPVAYQDPKRGYMLVAPPGARFQEGEGREQISIQSPKGYAINIQAGDTNPDIMIGGMFRKLEQQYLGDGRPWSGKSEEGEAVIAGLPAAYAVYESNSTRSRVVIARGEKTDFVFMFFAPTSHYEKLRTEFEWVLASFRPAASELPARPVALSKADGEAEKTPPLRAQPAPEPIHAGRPEKPSPEARPDVQVFSEQGYGYRLAYPAAWNLEKVSAFTNVISGPQGSPAYDAIVALQNVRPDGVHDAGEAARKTFDDLKAKLHDGAMKVDFGGEKPVTYAKGGLTLQGRQFVASYVHQGRQFRKWVLVIPRPEGEVAHVWSYTAPVEQFDQYRPVAEQILNSFRIDGGQG